MSNNQVIIYENGEVDIKVSLDNENETIWANTKDISLLFDIDRSVVSRHIKNIFKDGELDENMVSANFAHTTRHGALNNKTQTKMIKYYNMDIILAVGYRTNSKKAIEFRKWATKVLKEYIVSGYAINREKITQQRLANLEQDVSYIKSHINNNTLEPKQGIFYNGQIFDAYVFINDIIKSAKKSIVLIDNYIDEKTLTIFSKRDKNCKVTIYTKKITEQIQLDIDKHNAQYPQIEIKKFDLSHDRFLIVDDKEVYHIGASLKDLGNKWFAFSKIDTKSLEIMKRLK